MTLSYTSLATISAATNGINSLSFSSDGRLLASASDDNFLRVFDVESKFSTIWEFQGQAEFTAVAWIGQDLFAGSMDGELTVFPRIIRWVTKSRKQTVYEFFSPIASIEISPSGRQIAVCTGADIALVKKNDLGVWYHQDQLQRPSFGETETFSEPSLIATNAHFVDDEKACIVAYLHHGFWKSDLETGGSIQMRGLGEKTGFSTISPECNAIAATNIRTGIDWYRISADNLRKTSSTFEPQPHHSNIPIPTLFIHKGRALLMASTKGYVTIFDSKEGRRVQTLKHGGDQTWITAIAYIQPPGKRRLIATGDGNLVERTKIWLWIQDSGEDRSIGISWATLPVRLARKSITLAKNTLTFLGLAYICFVLLESQKGNNIENWLSIISQFNDTLFNSNFDETSFKTSTLSILSSSPVETSTFTTLRLANTHISTLESADHHRASPSDYFSSTSLSATSSLPSSRSSEMPPLMSMHTVFQNSLSLSSLGTSTPMSSGESSSLSTSDHFTSEFSTSASFPVAPFLPLPSLQSTGGHFSDFPASETLSLVTSTDSAASPLQNPSSVQHDDITSDLPISTSVSSSPYTMNMREALGRLLEL